MASVDVLVIKVAGFVMAVCFKDSHKVVCVNGRGILKWFLVLIGLQKLWATSDIHGLSVPSSAVSLAGCSKIKHRLKVTMR